VNWLLNMGLYWNSERADGFVMLNSVILTLSEFVSSGSLIVWMALVEPFLYYILAILQVDSIEVVIIWLFMTLYKLVFETRWGFHFKSGISYDYSLLLDHDILLSLSVTNEFFFHSMILKDLIARLLWIIFLGRI